MRYARVVLLLCGAFGLVAYGVHVRGDNARAIAKCRIEEYCKRNHISLSAMDGPIISKRYFYEWIFDYTSNTKPKHEVRLYINFLGVVQEHRLIEDQ